MEELGSFVLEVSADGGVELRCQLLAAAKGDMWFGMSGKVRLREATLSGYSDSVSGRCAVTDGDSRKGGLGCSGSSVVPAQQMLSYRTSVRMGRGMMSANPAGSPAPAPTDITRGWIPIIWGRIPASDAGKFEIAHAISQPFSVASAITKS